MKLGPEIEGRLKGIPSLILQYQELLFFTAEMLSAIATKNKASHIQIDAYGFSIPPINYKLAGLVHLGHIVSIESDVIPKEKVPNVNYILVVKNPSFWNLSETDQVKFVDFDRNVRMVSLENMHVTDPKDFDGDVILDTATELANV